MDNTVLSKIKKLLALSQSSNEHEAALAAARAQELMNQHKLTEADIAESVLEAENPMGEQWLQDDIGHYSMKLWKSVLLHGIAKVNNCFTYLYSGGRRKIVGRTQDRQITEYLACYLMREIERLAEAKYREAGYYDKRQLPQWTIGFGHGATAVILQRMRDEKRAFTVDHPSMNAIVLRDTTALAEYCRQQFGRDPKDGTVRYSRVNAAAYGAGREAGRDIQWRSAVNPAPQNRRLA